MGKLIDYPTKRSLLLIARIEYCYERKNTLPITNRLGEPKNFFPIFISR